MRAHTMSRGKSKALAVLLAIAVVFTFSFTGPLNVYADETPGITSVCGDNNEVGGWEGGANAGAAATINVSVPYYDTSTRTENATGVTSTDGVFEQTDIEPKDADGDDAPNTYTYYTDDDFTTPQSSGEFTSGGQIDSAGIALEQPTGPDYEPTTTTLYLKMQIDGTGAYEFYIINITRIAPNQDKIIYEIEINGYAHSVDSEGTGTPSEPEEIAVEFTYKEANGENAEDTSLMVGHGFDTRATVTGFADDLSDIESNNTDTIPLVGGTSSQAFVEVTDEADNKAYYDITFIVGEASSEIYIRDFYNGGNGLVNDELATYDVTDDGVGHDGSDYTTPIEATLQFNSWTGANNHSAISDNDAIVWDFSGATSLVDADDDDSYNGGSVPINVSGPFPKTTHVYIKVTSEDTESEAYYDISVIVPAKTNITKIATILDYPITDYGTETGADLVDAITGTLNFPSWSKVDEQNFALDSDVKLAAEGATILGFNTTDAESIATEIYFDTNLAGGSVIACIKVEAEDGTIKYYKITCVTPPQSNNSSLASLDLTNSYDLSGYAANAPFDNPTVVNLTVPYSETGWDVNSWTLIPTVLGIDIQTSKTQFTGEEGEDGDGEALTLEAGVNDPLYVQVTAETSVAGSLVSNYKIIITVKDHAHSVTIAPIPVQAWTGSQIKPSLAVTDGGDDLVEGGDYTLAYGANVTGTGTVILTSLWDNSQITVPFTITEPPTNPTAPTITSVTVDPASVSIEVGATAQLTASVLGVDGTNPATPYATTVTWSTSDAAKATVSSTGLVTAVAAGSVDITATSTADPSKKGTATVTITAKKVTPPKGTQELKAPKVSAKDAKLFKKANTTVTKAVKKLAKKAKVGKKVTVKAKAVKGFKITYQWYAGGKAIKKATKSSYKIAKAYKGKKLTVKVSYTTTKRAKLTDKTKAKAVYKPSKTYTYTITKKVK
jgi:hypothetical protein